MERWLTPMDDFYTTRPFTQEGNYLVNSCVVNAYTLYVKSPTMRTRKDTPILTDFCPQVAQTFFTEVYISRSCACWTRCRYKGIKPWKCVDGTFKSKRCKWIWCKNCQEKIQHVAVNLAFDTCAKIAAILHTIHNSNQFFFTFIFGCQMFHKHLPNEIQSLPRDPHDSITVTVIKVSQ